MKPEHSQPATESSLVAVLPGVEENSGALGQLVQLVQEANVMMQPQEDWAC